MPQLLRAMRGCQMPFLHVNVGPNVAEFTCFSVPFDLISPQSPLKARRIAVCHELVLHFAFDLINLVSISGCLLLLLLLYLCVCVCGGGGVVVDFCYCCILCIVVVAAF